METNVLRFDTKKHILSIAWGNGSEESEEYEEVMTIREGNGFYEVLQRQETGKNAPIYRLPINSTIIRYFH